MTPEHNHAPTGTGKEVWLAAVGVVAMALLVFKDVLPPGMILFSTDNNIGVEQFFKAALPGSFLGTWNNFELLGSSGLSALTWSYATLWLLPLRFYVNWIHALDLGVGTLFVMLFVRQRNLGWGAAAMAGLAAFWVGTNLTLTYSGHVGKFAVVMLSAVSLWLVERAVRTKRAAWSFVLGGVTGLTFNEQPDFALFFAMLVAGYMLFGVIREEGLRLGGLVRLFLPWAVVVILIAGPGVIGSYFSYVKGVAAVSEEDPVAKWEFCTQWSLPTDESIDLIAPGYSGLRSGEPAGPYWGRTGRSAEWDRTRKGFMNFRLDSVYIGAIPVVLALLALASAVSKRGGTELADERKRRHDIYFWAVAALISLLLSYGKYFPLYRLFYQLPMVSNIRNPIKFIQVFQLALAVLAAYGLDHAIRRWAGRGSAAPQT